MKFFQYIVKILIFVDLIFFVSCKKTTTKQDILLNEAELLAENNPVRALYILDSINNPSASLGNENYMRYLVAATQIRSKNGQNIKNDTLIEDAIKFYQNNNNSQQLIKAYFYAGNVYSIRDDRERAFKYFLKALDLSTNNGDLLFEGRSLYNLGYHYYYNNIKDTAGIYWKKSLNIFQQLDQKQNIAQNLYMLALLEFQNNKSDYSKKYAEEALVKAKEVNDKKTLFWTNNLLGIIAQEDPNDCNSIVYLNNALSNASDDLDSSKVYMNISRYYMKRNLSDSVLYFIKIVENRLPLINDLYTLRSMNLTLVDYYNSLKNNESANFHSNIAKKLDNLIEQKKITQTIYELDKQHTVEKYKEEELRKTMRYIIIGISIVLLLYLSYLFRDVKLKRKMTNLENEINRITKRK